MPSQKPITYDGMFQQASEEGRLRKDVRNNTHWEFDPQALRFDVYLFDSLIAQVYSDGRVRVDRRGHHTPTTKNRLNDVLVPLGWRVRIRNGRWYLATVHKPFRQMEFADGMILTNINHNDNDQFNR